MSGARSTRTASLCVNPPVVTQASLCSSCSRASKDTKMTVHNGLQIIRIRYGIPYVELPDLDVDRLGSYLQYLLLQGKVRASVNFPRAHGRRDEEGLVTLKRLSRYSRWEFAHSVNSIKRNLPSGCRLHVPSGRSKWESNAFSSPPPPSSEYLAFIKAEVTRLFPSCWDRQYDSFVKNHLPNSTSRFNRERADRLWAGRREEFRRSCTEETALPYPQGRYKEVLSAGKVRPLLIYDEWNDVLAPLHKMLYKHLARTTDWLLVGPPTAEKMESVCVGRYQTSVDLVNATDGLSLRATEVILDSLFFGSTKIPRSVRKLAYESLHPVVDGKIVRHGQMMGSYLSFPLLCLHSYLAARWAVRGYGDHRILVNGDDCVISADLPVQAHQYPSGYCLNDQKTIRSENVVEVNSTAFLRTRGGAWREVRHLRRGGFITSYDGLMHAAAAVRHSVVWTDAFVRSRIGRKWGLLPSQLELTRKSRVAWRRETTMRKTRVFSKLPTLDQLKCNPQLEWVMGVADPDEKEALADFFWTWGRDGGKKRDVFSPSIGEIRRSYRYRKIPIRSSLSFVGQLRSPVVPGNGRSLSYLVPTEYESERYLGRLCALEAFRRLACPT
nr:MAG: RNA-dependent RNA polymerase [Botourmiaviridae sp.]